MKSHNKAFAAVLVSLCIICSALFSFGGTYLANMLSGTEAAQSVKTVSAGSSEKASVIYQSVTSGELIEKMSIEEVVFNVKNTVVEITTETVQQGMFMGQYISTGAGSGVVITSDGYIVTNNHVVDGAKTIKVRLADGEVYEAELIGRDTKSDLAVIKIDETGLQSAVFGSSSNLLAGQTAVAIGNPLGALGGTVTSGIISALDRLITIDGESMHLLQTDTAINPGNSGGGLFNLYGELIGIVNAKSSGSEIEGLGFAIPIDNAKGAIEDLIDYGYVRGRIDTGLTLISIEDAQTAMMYRVNQTGLYVSSSNTDNLRPGDRITEVNGANIGNLADWNAQMDNYSIGDTLTITYIRNGKSGTALLTLTELKSA